MEVENVLRSLQAKWDKGTNMMIVGAIIENQW